VPSWLHDEILIIYLHGFASSSHSGKATYFAQRFQERGIEFHAPDLNLPEFSTLTVTRMLDQVRALIGAHEDVTLMGSSLGGFVAVHAAVKWPQQVRKVVLMAPALDFSAEGLSGPGMARVTDWKRDGHLTIFHYGYGRVMTIAYELYEDARRYDAMSANLRMPVLVFQGRQDTAVNPRTVETWSKRRPNVDLHMLDDDHQLSGSLAYMWQTIHSFLSLD
jgi:pimeloyl-ACP methyl ester carboxylesterase